MPSIDSQVLITVGLACVIATAFIAIFFMFFAARTARAGIKAIQETGSHAVTATGSAIEHIADRSAEIIRPLSDGVASIFESVAERIKLRQDDYAKLVLERTQLAQEIERLKSRHIDANRIKAQLKLALVETDQTFSHISYETLTKKDARFYESGAEKQERFLCIQGATYKCQIGLDIETLRFSIDGSVVWVYGLNQARLIGLSQIKIFETLAEVRDVQLDAESKVLSTSVIVNDPRLSDEIRKQRDKLMFDIQSDQSIGSFSAATAQFGLVFLQACLGPAGLQVVKSDVALDHAVTFYEVCELANADVLKASEKARSRTQEINALTDGIQAEITQLLLTPSAAFLSQDNASIRFK
jgi:hypothetical protein